jgi:hypothetical protein
MQQSLPIPFTGVRRRLAGSYQAELDGVPLGTFETIGEAAAVVEATEAQARLYDLIAELRMVAA